MKWFILLLKMQNSMFQKIIPLVQSPKDMCATNRPSTPVLAEFHWSMEREKWAAAPDALLVQVGCCYEGQGISHLFDENRRPLLALLERRLQGISGTVRDMSGDRLAGATISVWPIDGRKDGSRLAKTTKNGQFHLALEPDKYRALVSAEEFDPMSATFSVRMAKLIQNNFRIN
jgi:hypothetical protein